MVAIKRPMLWILGVFVVLCVAVGTSESAEKLLKMSTTTSTENSGLLDVLLPEFEKDSGIRIKVFAKGTGAAIRDGMEGNVDVILVHAKAREEEFVADGYGTYRLGVMHNDFIIIGPSSDPAQIKGKQDAAIALREIALSKARFVSRGDDSGTHMKEQALWEASGVPLQKETASLLSFQHPVGLGEWYFSIGQGMGKTLTFAEEKQAYTLADRGTYLKFRFGREQGLDLEVLCQGDPELFNPYGIIPVSPEKHPHVRFEWADQLAKWMVSPKGQALIGGYKIQGKHAFLPDAVPDAK